MVIKLPLPRHILTLTMNNQERNMLNCDAKLIWAAACAAQRIQGKYIKVTDVLQENQVPNRSIMLDLISSDDDNGILQEDYDLAENIKTFYSRLTFKMLTDEPMNNFKKEILKLVSAETITNIYQLTVLASIPSTYVREAKYDIIKNKISNATGNLFGVVKSNVELDIEIVKAFPSNHYYNT